MALRIGKFVLFALIAMFSVYNLLNIIIFGRTHVRHAPRVWTLFADDPSAVGLYGAVYLIATAVAALLCYEALVKPIIKHDATRQQSNVSPAVFFRAMLSAYLRPEK